MDKAVKYSLLTILMWAISDTTIRYSVSTLAANPVIFTFIVQIASALTLLAVAGRGPLSLDTLKALRTWTHSLFNVLTTLSFVVGVTYVSATEGTLLGRFDIVLGLLLPWIVLKRRPSKHDFIGMFIVLLGLYMIVLNLEPDIRIYAITAFSLNAFFATLRTIDAELHPTSIQADTNFKNRCRVSGVIMFAMATILLLVYISISGVRDLLNIDVLGVVFPPLDVAMNRNTILSALFTGVFTVAPAMYFYTHSAIHAKTEKFLMLGCFLPVLTFFVEFIFSQLGLLSLETLDYRDFISVLLIILGSMYMVIKRNK